MECKENLCVMWGLWICGIYYNSSKRAFEYTQEILFKAFRIRNIQDNTTEMNFFSPALAPKLASKHTWISFLLIMFH